MPEHPIEQSWRDDLKLRGLEAGRALSASIEIPAPQHTVWQRLSEPGHLKQCHPFCKETNVEQWPGAGARDSITYLNGEPTIATSWRGMMAPVMISNWALIPLNQRPASSGGSCH